jgi:hypothetical protein
MKRYSGFKDLNSDKIYDGDILKIITENNVDIQVTCRYGSSIREFSNGCICEIMGFYFERPDGEHTFPIVNNYLGKHDCQLMVKIKK